MQLRCPQCHEQFEIVAEQDFSDVNCPECGSTFSLLGSETVDFRQSPSVLGHFELIDRLGAGQFGVVWKARDTQLDRVVAMKVPRRGQLTSEETELFFRDARAAAQLRHPGIVAVHEVGRSDENVFIVTDYIEGADLKEWLTGQRLTSRESAELMALIADAVQHAHAHGVIHRDLKPSNVLMDMHGRPHITDFGLAKRETGEMTMTMDGQVIGTPAFMSPEQAQGKSHHADARSDVYSLRVILYQLLTGKLPFRGESRMLIVQIMRDEPPPPRKLNARIPRDLETITLKCLEKAPDKRYQTAEEFGNDLKRFLSNQPVLARPVGRVKRAWRWAGRNPAVAALSVGLFGALVIGLAATSGLWLKAEIARQQATEEAARATAVSDLLLEALETANPDAGKGAYYTVAQLLDDLSSGIGDKLENQPESEAAIRATIGNAYRRMELLDKAKPELKTALELRKRVYGQQHEQVAESLNDYAFYLTENRELIEAEKQAREATAIHRNLGLKNRDTVKIFFTLQLTLYRQGRLADSEAVAQEALLIARQLPDPPPDMPNILHVLAAASNNQNKAATGELLAREAVELHHRLHGDNHTETAWGLYILGNSLAMQQKYDEAELAYREALAIFRKLVSESHSGMIATLSGLTRVLAVKGDEAGLVKLYAEYPSFGGSRDQFAVATGTFPVEVARGKHVVYSGWIKTEDVDERAGLWWRVDGSDKRRIALDNMQDRGPHGTSDWTRFSIELDIPKEATNINFGVLMPGKGRAWFDGLEVTLDGKPYIDHQFEFDFEVQKIKEFYVPEQQKYRTQLDDQVAKSGKQSLRMESTSKPTKVDTKIYADYVGRYELEFAGALTTVSQDGDRLMVQLTGQPARQVYPDSETRFSYRVVDAQITFERDESGKVDQLILHQNGRDLTATKLESGTEPVAVKIDPKLLDEYVGTYRQTVGLVFTVTKDKDQLWVQLTGQPKIEVYPKSPTRFFYKVVVAEIEFRKDEAGQVDGLTLFQGGNEIFAAKDKTAKDE